MLDLIVVIPILIKRYKYDIDLGTMLVEGLLRAAIWAAIFLGAAFLIPIYLVPHLKMACRPIMLKHIIAVFLEGNKWNFINNC